MSQNLECLITIIIMQFLSAAYGEPVKTIDADKESFLSFPMRLKRYHELWLAMTCRRSFASPTRTSKSWSNRRGTFTYVQNMNVHECKRSCTFKIWSNMLEPHWCHGFFGTKNSKILVQWMCTIFLHSESGHL